MNSREQSRSPWMDEDYGRSGGSDPMGAMGEMNHHHMSGRHSPSRSNISAPAALPCSATGLDGESPSMEIPQSLARKERYSVLTHNQLPCAMSFFMAFSSTVTKAVSVRPVLATSMSYFGNILGLAVIHHASMPSSTHAHISCHNVSVRAWKMGQSLGLLLCRRAHGRSGCNGRSTGATAAGEGDDGISQHAGHVCRSQLHQQGVQSAVRAARGSCLQCTHPDQGNRCSICFAERPGVFRHLGSAHLIWRALEFYKT